MSREKNQTTEVKKALMAGAYLTSKDAFALYGCTRLSAKIHELRKHGMDIETIPVEGVNRYGDTTRYAMYHLNKPKKTE